MLSARDMSTNDSSVISVVHDGTADNYGDQVEEDAEEVSLDGDDITPFLDEGLEIQQWTGSSWSSIRSSDVSELLHNGAPLRDKGWLSASEFHQYLDVTRVFQETIVDAVAVLAETVGGAAKEWWHLMRTDWEEHNFANYYWTLQALIILVSSPGNGAWADTDWWEFHDFCIPSRGLFHRSSTSNKFEGRILFDFSPGRPWRDLAHVMQIVLPRFREMNARAAVLRHVDCSNSDSTTTESNMFNIILCLDVAESVAKMVPVFGDILEGACAALRKILQAAEGARAAREECRALAEHTACITLAIVNEIGSASSGSGAELKKIWDLSVVIGEVNRRIQKFSKLGRMKYFASRTKIAAQVLELRARVDNARISFQIRNDISTTRLLYDLTVMQARLMSRVDDIYKLQKMMNGKLDMTHSKLDTTDRKLDMILVQMHVAGPDHVKVGNVN